MPPRRSHKKSRAGCRRCKTRKIKCDEAHPRCGNCVKHGVYCDFEHPELAESLGTPDTPSTISAASPIPGDGLATGMPPPNSVGMTSGPAQLHRHIDPPAVSQALKGDRMMELRLLHFYTTMTCKTLNIDDPMNENIFRDTVPNIAFGGANFLADAVLAVSALHLRSTQPQNQQIIRASHAYMASSLSEYSNTLSKGINETNAVPLFLTATFIAFQSSASRVFMREDGGDAKDRTGPYTLPISWFYSLQGVKTVVASSWQWLRKSDVVLSIIQAQPALDPNMSSQRSTFFGNLLDGMDEELLAQDPDLETQDHSRKAYQHAVGVLNWAHKIPLSGAPIVFLATVSRRYIQLLQARRPRAMAILASFFGLLKSLDTVWWLRGIARREIMGIISLFDPGDHEWWSRLQWPVRVAIYEGDVIPAKIWGAERVGGVSLPSQVQQSGGGFISHIELLSQMASVMQNMPHISADAVADLTYNSVEGQIIAQDIL